MRISSLAFIVAIAATACTVRTRPAPATGERRDDRRDAAVDRASQWDKLGERWVDGRVDRDVIAVTRRERYSRIKLVVEHSAVEIFDVNVVFGNGEKFDVNTRLIFGEGTTSREIDLPGGLRDIERIEFKYGNLPGGGKAQVEVWGLGGRRT